MIVHYDLFAGIGGFSLALEEVFHDRPIRHIFCEWSQFPTAVLKQHWPGSDFWGDIAELVEHTKTTTERGELTIVTGGFPCQPFSQAGRRKGTADDRYQWPNMFEVIRNVRPDWVIAENVRGLVTWNDGMVLEQVCSDLESQGYEVRPFIIPALAVNAPHKRDRVWIVVNAINRGPGAEPGSSAETNRVPEVDRSQHSPARESVGANSDRLSDEHIADAGSQRRSQGSDKSVRSKSQESVRPDYQYPDWLRAWPEVAFATCDDSMDDGLPRLVDGVPISRSKWRADSLKAYGNGIVPQIAMELIRAIRGAEESGA